MTVGLEGRSKIARARARPIPAVDPMTRTHLESLMLGMMEELAGEIRNEIGEERWSRRPLYGSRGYDDTRMDMPVSNSSTQNSSSEFILMEKDW
jgi:hypothetical protein